MARPSSEVFSVRADGEECAFALRQLSVSMDNLLQSKIEFAGSLNAPELEITLPRTSRSGSGIFLSPT